MFDGEKFGKEVVEVIKDYMVREVGPLRKRVEALERRASELETKAKR